MKAKLKEYIDTIFEDAERRAPHNERLAELKEEMLQNLYEKYEDLVVSGRSPAAAYNVAIAGVGDISGLLDEIGGGNVSAGDPQDARTRAPKAPLTQEQQEALNRYRERVSILRAIAIAMYILCVVPCMFTETILGPVLMFVMIAGATALMIISGGIPKPYTGEASACGEDDDDDEDDEDDDDGRKPNRGKDGRPRRSPVYNAISGALWILTVCAYLIVSFATGHWHITWMIFLITTALDNVIKAIFDLRR